MTALHIEIETPGDPQLLGFSDVIPLIKAGCPPASQVGLEVALPIPWSHTAASHESAGYIGAEHDKRKLPYILAVLDGLMW